jgi:hypothetical protein
MKYSNFLLRQRAVTEEAFSIIRKSERTGGRPFYKGGGSDTEKRKTFIITGSTAQGGPWLSTEVSAIPPFS